MSDNKAFIRRLITADILILSTLQIIYTIMSVWSGYIAGDIAHPILNKVLPVVISMLAILLVYFRMGVVLWAYHTHRRATLPFTLVTLGSFVLSRISECIVYAAVYSDFSVRTVGDALFSLAADTAVLVILWLISRSPKETKRGPALLFVTACALPLAAALAEEIFFLVYFLGDINREYGSMSMTGEEIASVISAFATPVITAILGYGVMLLTYRYISKKKL